MLELSQDDSQSRRQSILRRPDGRYLLLHRSSDKYPEVKDLWDIAGGRIEIGTPLFDNLRREVREETTLEVRDPIKLIAAQDILKSKDKHVVRLTYVAAVTGEPHLDEEHDDYGWFTAEEMLAKGDQLNQFARAVLVDNPL